MKMVFRYILVACLMSSAFAETDLLEVFRQAYLNDPTYQEIVAKTLAAQEDIGISRAALLPNIDFTVVPSKINSQNSGSVIRAQPGSINQALLPANNILLNNEMRLSLRQTIFNYAKFANLAHAGAGARQASALLNAALQDLIVRVAQAYFNILQDEEHLRYCNANKAALARQYQEAIERFKIKSIAKTDLYNAKSAYYSSRSNCVSIETQLAIDKEFLRTMTNKSYHALANLNKRFPLISPQPNDSEAWVNKAIQQNWNIKAKALALQAAKERIKQQFSGHLPTIEFEGFYDVNAQHSQKGSILVTQGSSKFVNTVYTLNANFPIFSGGAVMSEVNQAQYNYQQIAQQLESSIRNTIYNTRQSYLTILSTIQKIDNDKIAITSGKISVEAMNERYKSGIGTMLDVLNQREKLLNDQFQYASDRYSYIMNLLSLKNAAGTLDVNDVLAINSWLIKRDA